MFLRDSLYFHLWEMFDSRGEVLSHVHSLALFNICGQDVTFDSVSASVAMALNLNENRKLARLPDRSFQRTGIEGL